MFGTVIDDLQTVFNQAPQYLGIAAQVLADPAFPQVVSLASRIANAGAPTVPYPPGTLPPLTVPPGYPPGYIGVGLDRLITPLEILAWYEENPVLGGLALLAVVATPFVIGYLLHK